MRDRRKLRIASRGSRLALWQAENIRQQILAAHDDVSIDIEVVRTTGDRIVDVPLASIGDRGLFTKEIDDALLNGAADLAVHSLKDVPTRLADGLDLAAISAREDPRDVLIAREGTVGTLDGLPRNGRVGTSSLRRRALLGSIRPDLEVVDLRGNLGTRLERLDAGAHDAIILAAAGVLRLGWVDRISQYLPVDLWLPAVGQGALAIVIREGDADLAHFVEVVDDGVTAACVEAERSFLRSLQGGCQVPIGALATLADHHLFLDGFVADVDGKVVLRDQESGDPETATLIGARLARKLCDLGAMEVLHEARRGAEPPWIPAP